MSANGAPRLDQLQELPSPEPLVSYWPQTWAWGVLLLLLLAALAIVTARRWRRWQRDRYRREALTRLAELERALTDELQRLAALREIPELLKRVALSMPGGPQVAALGGADWQRFLERTSHAPLPPQFTQQLGTLAYAPEPRLRAFTTCDLQTLLGACRQWIEKHHVAT